MLEYYNDLKNNNIVNTYIITLFGNNSVLFIFINTHTNTHHIREIRYDIILY